MSLRIRRFFAFVLALAMFVSAGTLAQTQPPPGAGPPPPGSAPPPAAPLPQDQLDALLAPIALYPDQLLSQILMASTYPLDVVEAARFVEQNPGLKGPALDQALQDKRWDPSVLSLTAFPQVLAMMNDKLEWTQQLGDAFLANEAQVMQTVQSLRARAQAAGNLQSTPQQTVVVQDRSIIIEPAQPDVVYVPVYNPTIVYGPWWAPAYTPWFWYPPPIYGYPPLVGAIGVGFVWGTAWAVSANHWGWSHPNWRGGSINVNVNHNYFVNRPYYKDRYSNGNWAHIPEQRRGVAYHDTAVQNRYRPNNPGVQTREAYRGREPGGQFAGAGTQRPAPNQFGGQGTQRPAPGQLGAQGTQRPAPGQLGAQGAQRSAPGQLGAQGAQRPATGQVGTPGGQRPSTMERPGSVSSATPAARPGPAGAGAQFERGAGTMSRQTPTYNPAQTHAQVQQFSNRGAQSRAAMNAPAPGGAGPGGAARPGAGGGGPRPGGGEARGGGHGPQK